MRLPKPRWGVNSSLLSSPETSGWEKRLASLLSPFVCCIFIGNLLNTPGFSPLLLSKEKRIVKTQNTEQQQQVIVYSRTHMGVSTGSTTNTTVVHKLDHELRGNAPTVKSLSLTESQSNQHCREKLKKGEFLFFFFLILKEPNTPCCTNSIPSNQIAPYGMFRRTETSRKPIYNPQSLQNQKLIMY